jgi:hypothetical protein
MKASHPIKQGSKKEKNLCIRLVKAAAEKYKVPGCFITAHVSSPLACHARSVVWKELIDKHGLTRRRVAEIFGRDIRRLRASVLKETKTDDLRGAVIFTGVRGQINWALIP